MEAIPGMTQGSVVPTPKTILFIDDDKLANVLRKRIFRRHGYRVFTADCGASGLKVLQRKHIDLVVVDYVMPEMNGAECVEQIRKINPKLPIIMHTGSLDIAGIVPVDELIEKGEYSVHNLYKAIRKYLHPHEEHQSPTLFKKASNGQS